MFWVTAGQIAVVLAYPVLIFVALHRAGPRAVALLVLALLALKALLLSPQKLVGYANTLRVPALTIGAVTVASAIWNDSVGLLLTPSLISLALLITFARSLRQSESVVESLARMQLGLLSNEEAQYCRRVTVVWCLFFLFNGFIALYLALFGTLLGWAVYTGLIAYLLMGLLFASEYVYRHWRFRRYVGAPTDPLFRRIFPPRSPPAGGRTA